MANVNLSQLLFAVLAIVLATSPAAAQTRTKLDTTAACAAAVKGLTTGSVASRPPFQRRICGADAASAVATAFRVASQSADTLLWADLYAMTGEVLDGRMIDAGEAVARDRSASVIARAVTMSALVTAYRPGAFIVLPQWRALIESSAMPERYCVQVMPSGPTIFGGVPKDIASRVASTFDAIAAEVESPAVVRALAACARRFVTDVSPQAKVMTAAYVCDNIFAVTTSARATDGVRVRVEGEPGLKQLLQSTFSVRLSSVRDFRMLVNDQPVASASHGHVSCVAERYRKSGRAIPLSVDTLEGWAR